MASGGTKSARNLICKPFDQTVAGARIVVEYTLTGGISEDRRPIRRINVSPHVGGIEPPWV